MHAPLPAACPPAAAAARRRRSPPPPARRPPQDVQLLQVARAELLSLKPGRVRRSRLAAACHGTRQAWQPSRLNTPSRSPRTQAVYQKRGELLLLTDRREAVQRVEQQLAEAQRARQAAPGSSAGQQ